jgi:hypothetical protein
MVRVSEVGDLEASMGNAVISGARARDRVHVEHYHTDAHL